jgi:hypothetical protein
MGYQDFISETEASSFTGVSPQTLNRFAEAGYLQIEEDSDGMRLFSRGELSNVFGIGNQPSAFSDSPEPPLENPGSCHFEIPEAAEPPANAINATLVQSDAETVEDEKIVATPDAAAQTADEPAPVAAEPKEEAPVIRLTRTLEQEVSKLKHVVDLQEKLLDLREAEIKDLKEERNWLRSRVEKLEEKGDRDQLLLLSETQLIRKLVVSQQKRSPLRTALEWLGVIEPEKPQAHAMIDVSEPNPNRDTSPGRA